MGTLPKCMEFGLAALLLVACGDSGSSDKHEQAGAGAVAGAGAGAGGSAGSSMVAGSGGAGSGGQQAGVDKPSTDCSTHTETVHCLSFKGMLDGRRFDKTCLTDTGGLRQDVTINHAWSVSCEDTVTHAYAVVSIAKQMAGAFHYTADQHDGFTVGIDVFDGMSDASSDLPSVGDAVIDGEVQMAGTHPLLVGTFHATWTASMDSGCPSGGCPAAQITGSFRSEFDF